jgi:hypothetical protein
VPEVTDAGTGVSVLDGTSLSFSSAASFSIFGFSCSQDVLLGSLGIMTDKKGSIPIRGS